MKKLLIIFCFLPLGLSAQETTYRYFSYTEFFKMIEDEPNDTFVLKNAIIEKDTITDKAYLGKIVGGVGNYEPIRKDTIFIKKTLNLENVHFDPIRGSNRKYFGILNHLVFLEPASFTNVSGKFNNVLFKKRLRIDVNESINEIRPTDFKNSWLYLQLNECTINDITLITQSATEEELKSAIWLESSKFKGAGRSMIFVNFLRSFRFNYNEFVTLNTPIGFSFIENNQVTIEANDFNAYSAEILIGKSQNQSIQIVDNTFENRTILKIPESIDDIRVDWSQFKSGVVDMVGYYDFFQKEYFPKLSDSINDYLLKPEIINEYRNSYLVPSEKYFKSEVRLLGTLNAIYKRQHDMQSANASYITLKDLETERLKYLYEQKPSFDTYFEWKVNQFLKLFSDYGTKPSKAIVFSVYVILAFALIYLLFPNSWDAHGKNRIVDRYRFFFKYLQRNAGIHEVYLEEKKQNLLGYEEFKSIITNSEKSVPRFFSATALPLYHWAVSGTLINAKILSKVDILKGTWEDLPAGQKVWKSFLLVGGFLIALVYDLLIKVLNALMLSINTFTTLGFGEIPIKGLPRYLAIIQGFIGWFMLTIFSVSLISQLLN